MMDGQAKVAWRGRAWRVGLFVALVLAMNTAVWWLGQSDRLAALDIFVSWVVAGLSNACGIPMLRQSNQLVLSHSVWIVSTECTALYLVFLFSSLVLVYPTRPGPKLMALAAGIPVILGCNIVRLLVMAWVDRDWPEYNALFHDYVWQVLFIGLVAGLWLVWLEWVAHGQKETAAAT